MRLHSLIKSLRSLYLEAPEIEFGRDRIEEFDTIYNRALDDQEHKLIKYDSPHPKYEFLQYLVERKEVLLHGSNEMDIGTLMPMRLSTDTRFIGNLQAAYACSDGIWPIFFATLNRKDYFGSTSNDCFWAEGEDRTRKKLYYFSIESEWLNHQPWTNGMVYVVPRYTFSRLKDAAGNALEEWASKYPARVLAKLLVSPQDFPFLSSVRVYQLSAASPLGKAVKIAPDKLDSYTGRYEVAPGLLVTVKRSGDQLLAEATGFPAVELQPESENIFFIRALDVRLLFNINDEGRVLECRLQL